MEVPVNEFLEWPNALEEGNMYIFSVRTVLNCSVAAGVELTSDWVDVNAYTSPGMPIIEQVNKAVFIFFSVFSSKALLL